MQSSSLREFLFSFSFFRASPDIGTLIVADLVRFYSALEQKQCTHASLLTLNPVSPFDEKLAEDNKVNRLEDSYVLWKSVCACKLLARTQLILCTA